MRKEKDTDIDKKCQEIYEEIETIRNRLLLDLPKLCSLAFQYSDDNDDTDDFKGEAINQKKYYEKYKKIFQRKNWKYQKSTQHTLHNLEDFRTAIYCTDEYRAKEECVYLNHKHKQLLKEASDYLESKLRSRDYEE